MGLARSLYALGRMGEAAQHAFDAMELGGPLESRAEACMLIGHTYLDPVTFEDQVPGTEMLVPEREQNIWRWRPASSVRRCSTPPWTHPTHGFTLREAFALAGRDRAAASKLYEAYLEHDPNGLHAAEVRL